jgi:hypothetical protein
MMWSLFARCGNGLLPVAVFAWCVSSVQGEEAVTSGQMRTSLVCIEYIGRVPNSVLPLIISSVRLSSSQLTELLMNGADPSPARQVIVSESDVRNLALELRPLMEKPQTLSPRNTPLVTRATVIISRLEGGLTLGKDHEGALSLILARPRSWQVLATLQHQQSENPAVFRQLRPALVEFRKALSADKTSRGPIQAQPHAKGAQPGLPGRPPSPRINQQQKAKPPL